MSDAIEDSPNFIPKHDHDECHRILRAARATEKERDQLQATVAMLAAALRKIVRVADSAGWSIHSDHRGLVYGAAAKALSDTAVKRAMELDEARCAVVSELRLQMKHGNGRWGSIYAALARLAELEGAK